ncbi:acyltransferase family protein [Sphingomonas endolithica]|uniref:acyltransferase family protein n=1 Tax=Sphingomonas endolithica TaxID=2972485 RepID=UPI0021AFE2ED|nr:acyltransferase [Sphingomonas sp. ZFBP2030]
MQSSAGIKRFGNHENAFGFLRLFFASLVIVSHTPELVDGNRNRELLTRFFGTISFGELAVDAFFLISGYLILGSYLKLPKVWPYLSKRIARLYPAFIVASFLSFALVAPLSGGSAALAHLTTWIKSVVWMALLQPPVVPGSFVGSSVPVLNDAMWTIAYEFRCYLLVLALGLMGAFRYPRVIVALAVGCLALYQIIPSTFWQGGWGVHHIDAVLGNPGPSRRLTGIYLMGCVFFLYRDSIKFTREAVAIAAIVLFGSLFIPWAAEPAVATFGAYIIFAVAQGKVGVLNRINNRNDISYGVYLYAWPIEQLLMWYWPGLPLLALGLLTFAIACGCGWLSWLYVERPVMRLLRQPDNPRRTDGAAVIYSGALGQS